MQKGRERLERGVLDIDGGRSCPQEGARMEDVSWVQGDRRHQECRITSKVTRLRTVLLQVLEGWAVQEWQEDEVGEVSELGKMVQEEEW